VRGKVGPDLSERCPVCLLREEWCYCSAIPTLRPKVQLVIIRHWKERCRTSNTAQLLQRAIPGTVLVDYGAPGGPLDQGVLDVPSPVLLFPEGPTDDHLKPETLVVVDGSWPQARKMVQRVPGVSKLPRLCLQPSKRPPTRLRKPPMRSGMATIEAVARALDHLEGAGTGAPLDQLYDHFVDTLRRMRGMRQVPR